MTNTLQSGLPLFDYAFSPLARRHDAQTSLDAGARIQPRLSALQAQVVAAFVRLGPMTDAQLEALPEFSSCAPSTIRKRRTELYRNGILQRAGRDVLRAMTIWQLNHQEESKP